VPNLLTFDCSTNTTCRSTAYENASSNFRLHTPSDYQFLSDATSYNVNLSEGRKMESRCRYLLQQRDKILFEMAQLEAVMNIDRQWEPSDCKYKEAVEYINTRKYRQALEHLHKLVVQRLFELHKMNLSNTGTLQPTIFEAQISICNGRVQNAHSYI
jgi:hypothetical protein